MLMMANLVIFLSHRIWIVLGTWFGTGLIKGAPGTWGTLVGMCVMVPLVWGLPAWFFWVLTLILFLLGIKASAVCQNYFHKKDAKQIVIDEVVGVMVPLGLFPVTFLNIVLIFIFFRIFDIIKIWPANFIDLRMKTAFGVMLDDVVAGIYTVLAVYFINKLLYVNMVIL